MHTELQSEREQRRAKAWDLAALAKSLRDSGDQDASLKAYAAAADAWRGLDAMQSAHAARHAGDLARQLGKLEAADGYVADALFAYREHEVPPLELANTLRVSALVKQAQGKPDQAKTIWRQAKQLYLRAKVQAGVDEADAALASMP